MYELQDNMVILWLMSKPDQIALSVARVQAHNTSWMMYFWMWNSWIDQYDPTFIIDNRLRLYFLFKYVYIRWIVVQ